MKSKNILIIAGFIIIVLLLVVFVYLLFFGTPRSVQEIFGNLGPAGEPDRSVVIPAEPTPEPEPTATRPRLRQLTQRPVAGFVETMYNDQVHIQYVEMGTGHIYRIDLLAGPENRLSNTTVAEASQAVFSSDGSRVAIRGGNAQRYTPITLGKVQAGGEMETTQKTGQIEEFHFVGTSTFLFTERYDGVGLKAKALKLETNSTENLFTVPFYEARVIWGTSTNSTHYAYVKPSRMFKGYLYSFTNSRMRKVPIEGFGLTVLPPSSDLIMFSVVEDSTYLGRVRDMTTGLVNDVPLVAFPEKCTSTIINNDYVAWCAHQSDRNWSDGTLPDAWYRGQISFSDNIYEVNLAAASKSFLVDTFMESQREIDIQNMSIGSSQLNLYFINKNDNTLWLYEL